MTHRTMTQALAGGRESVGGIAFTRDELTTERVSFEAGIGRQVPTGVAIMGRKGELGAVVTVADL